MRKTWGVSLLMTLCLSFFSDQAAAAPLLAQNPTINRNQIAFSYAGDLWLVGRDGGQATHLTTGEGIENDPYFSPDGSQIAFTGEYDGNVDVYVVPTTGGVPRRLTFHPGADRVAGWTPDGKNVLFRSNRNSTSGYNRLFTISTQATGLPQEVPLPLADDGAFSPDGSQIAYQPLTRWQPDWKRYRGGQTAAIWIARLSDSAIEKVPRQNSIDFNPMWVGDKVYFLSDRNGAVTLFVFDTKTKQVSQAVENKGLDFKSASATTDAIVYEQFGSLGLFDLRSGKTQAINVTVEADFPGIRPRFEKVGSQISNAAISPTGARAVFEARGEIITVPAEKGDPRNLTNSPGVMERDPSWSPDGKWIAYFSEASGEYALHVTDQKGGEVKKFPLGANPSFYYSPTWSPDSQKIAFYDTANTLWYLQIDKGTLTKVDTNPFGLRDNVVIPNWSPDSRWIAYVKQLPNLLRAVFVYSLEDNKFRQVTDGMSDARHVNFDKSGKYLYFSASTNIGPSLSFADLSGIAHQVTRSLYLVVLRSDLPSPLAPESSDEKGPDDTSEKKPEGGDAAKPNGSAGPGAAEKKPVEPVRIDFDEIEQRILALPLPTSNYLDLTAGKANTLFILEAPPPGPGAFGLIVHKFDLEKRKAERILANVGSFAVSANGEKMLYQTGPQWMIAPTGMPGGMPGGRPGEGPGKPGEGSLNVAAMEVRVEPRAEWKQMFYEIWRHERDFFYDPNLHGLNVEKVVKTYEPFLASVNHRSDLNYLFVEMLNQLTVGHMFISGGDLPDVKRVPGGLLGADYTIDQNRYRFARVYNGENWNPQVKAPLTQPGVNVKAGEYLLAVNGRDLTARDNVYAAFESMAGKSVLIKVGPTPDGVGAREVTVVPVGSEAPLRNLAWIEGNRRKVEQLSGGKLGYVYIPDTGFGGYNSFNRYFFSQTNKDGAVIDERFNGGGLLADYIVSYLSRPQLNFIRYRHGADVNVPAGAIYGPKVLLINELAGSGGDALPWYFRKMNVGQMIGKRTWGGLIAAFGAPTLMDGGRVTAPDAALYGLKGEWEVENAGVAPDIEVEFDPAAWRQGRDPQLEKGVEVLLEDLKKNPRPQYPQPKYPNYHQNTNLGGKP